MAQTTESYKLTEDWPALRVAHLQGGLRATSRPDRTVVIEPDSTDGKIASFTISKFSEFFPVLRELSLTIIGADFYAHRGDVDGSNPPNWRAYNDLKATTWPSTEQADHWSFLAQGAFQAKKGELWDICSRVSYQLRICAWRVRDISQLYQRQLMARLVSEKFKEGIRFQDGFTWLGYLAVQSYLVDACVLRDYFAEFYWYVLRESGAVKEPERVRQMSALKKVYLDKVEALPAETYLRSAVADGGWLRELGAYRDLVVHVAPLAKAAGGLFAVMNSISLSGDGRIPLVKLPLPPDPKKINDSRVSGAHFADPEMKFARFAGALEGPTPTVDCLEYTHRTLGQMSFLAWDLAKLAPVQAIIPDFTDEIRSHAVRDSQNQADGDDL